MRLLADENYPGPLVQFLRSLGHDVLWARTDCQSWPDLQILDLAEGSARVVLTLDKDFWQIAVQRRGSLVQSGVVLFRVHPAIPENLKPVLLAFLESEASWLGHVSIVSSEGIEMIAARRDSK